jgi:hypothetical protein
MEIKSVTQTMLWDDSYIAYKKIINEIINEAYKRNNINYIIENIRKSTNKTGINYFYQYGSFGYVYFLVKNNAVVYIGQSSVRNRLLQHQKNKDYDDVYYFYCRDDDHYKIETELIRRFPTKYNCCNVAKASFAK